ncbi:hypothetical protein LSCM1_06375 [Leishmania martiniquensis]|uniref:Uncharacterized protein n=1 Tax=Leishmania martiniquensis TaxID=1580590 RepID=A0A836GRF0_9TRYP|nr:hypothetical protein LSCM1_06375 [Leishmania martiniquensis]
MFEEALRQAPREELVEHIRLQRELIQRLHRRVLELESTLESAYTCPSAGDGASGADGCQAALSEQQRDVFSSDACHGASPPMNGQGVNRAPDGVLPAAKGATLLGTHRETSLSLSERWPTDSHGAIASLEPRRQLSRFYTEERALSAFARLPSSSQRQTGARLATTTPTSPTDDATPAPIPPRRPVTRAPDISTGLTSSLVDHPTVLEGIKEINYVLAAHRAGRPALPLPVVEELEDIRTRLLRGFKQTHIMSGGGDGEAQGVASAVCQAYGALPKGVEAVLGDGRSDLSLGRCVDDVSGMSRVRPRWISPDSSRVVYGTPSHPYQ